MNLRESRFVLIGVIIGSLTTISGIVLNFVFTGKPLELLFK